MYRERTTIRLRTCAQCLWYVQTKPNNTLYQSCMTVDKWDISKKHLMEYPSLRYIPKTHDVHTCCRAFGSGAVPTCFYVYDLGLTRQGFEHLTFCIQSEACINCTRFHFYPQWLPRGSELEGIPGKPRRVPGNPRLVPGNLRHVPGNYRLLPGNPRVIPGHYRLHSVTLDRFRKLHLISGVS